MLDLLLTGGKVITEASEFVGNISIKDGKIATITDTDTKHARHCVFYMRKL